MISRPTSTVMCSLLAVVLLGGCANNKTQHAKWVDNADARWNGMRASALTDMAQGQFDAGQLDQAHATIRDAASIDPDDPAVHLLAGRIALENSLLERAYKHFGTCIDKSLERADTDVIAEAEAEAEADADVDAGDFTLTLDSNPTAYLAALQSSGPHAAEAFYYRAVVLQRWQRKEEALADYQVAAQLDTEHPGRVLAAAETLVELDRVDEAVELLEEKKVFFDQNAGCRALLGHIHNLRSDYPQAVENFREAALLDPEDMRLQEELAFAQVRSAQWAGATATLRELTALEANAHRDDLWRSLATAEAENGRHEEARGILADLTRRNPGEVADWIRLGETCWKMQDLGGALIAANRTVDLAPRCHEGYLLSGLVWQKRERPHEALQMFDAAADAAPQNATPVILRGIALEKSDRLAAAAEAYREALQRDPNDPRAAQLLARLERGASVAR